MNLMTVQEVAETLRVSPMTVRRYIQSGKLAAVRVGRGVRVEQAAVEQFVTPIVAGQPQETQHDRNRLPEGRPFSFDDPLWNIVGIIQDGPPDLAANHDKYLAEAYADKHDS